MRLCFLAFMISLCLTAPAFADMSSKDVNTVITSAYQGNAVAQYQLALMLMSGKGVKPDEVLATSWLQCSASQGITEAQYQLALKLLDKNKASTAAYKWLLLSEGKNPDRIALRQKVEAEIQPELVSIIKKQAQTWRPKPVAMTEYVKGKHPACFDQQ